MTNRPTDASPGATTADAEENARAAAPAPLLPPALLHALDRAAEVAAELEARRLSVHFETGGGSRVRAQVVDADGNVIRELPVGEALRLLSGQGSSPAAALGEKAP